MPEPVHHRAPPTEALDVDALIVGGGICGLWTLDALTRAGFGAVLLERSALGDGQSIWSQGIIHSGLKYTLSGQLGKAAKAIRDMPARWESALAGGAGTSGDSGPDLRAARVRSPHCWLWRTDSVASRVGMIGARAGLRVAPVVVDEAERPAPLRACPGTVARLDEPVIDVASVLDALAAPHADRVFLGELTQSTITKGPLGTEPTVRVSDRISIRPRWIVVSAGNGAPGLHRLLGMQTARMQVRPLRMVMVRGEGEDLPELYGHCVDGAKTRVTITSVRDAENRVVWQVGGEVAERGASLDADAVIRLAREELATTVPGVDISRCAWATYEAPRAEGQTGFGARPTGPTVETENRVITVWPTKLALAPVAADMVVKEIARSGKRVGVAPIGDVRAERPGIALGPWDDARTVWSA